MKLRIRGNSLRLRLSQSDLAALLECGAVEEQVLFPGGRVLRYRLERSSSPAPTAAFVGETVTVAFSAESITAWADPAEVSMTAVCKADDSELRVLVEKDYRCLAPRADEDDADLFPNPEA